MPLLVRHRNTNWRIGILELAVYQAWPEIGVNYKNHRIEALTRIRSERKTFEISVNDIGRI